jgi:hypothetical protein
MAWGFGEHSVMCKPGKACVGVIGSITEKSLYKIESFFFSPKENSPRFENKRTSRIEKKNDKRISQLSKN